MEYFYTCNISHPYQPVSVETIRKLSRFDTWIFVMESQEQKDLIETLALVDQTTFKRVILRSELKPSDLETCVFLFVG